MAREKTDQKARGKDREMINTKRGIYGGGVMFVPQLISSSRPSLIYS